MQYHCIDDATRRVVGAAGNRRNLRYGDADLCRAAGIEHDLQFLVTAHPVDSPHAGHAGHGVCSSITHGTCSTSTPRSRHGLHSPDKARP
jgi:hypothetical protein